MKNARVSLDPEAARLAAAYTTRTRAIDYVMEKLAAVDDGGSADLIHRTSLADSRLAARGESAPAFERASLACTRSFFPCRDLDL